MKKSEETTPVPLHQWTHDGEDVLIVRFVPKDGKSYGDFQHPVTVGETVTATDWNPAPECGGGIHGWPWALGIGEGKNQDWTATWQVYAAKPSDVVWLNGKVKFRTGVLKFVGAWNGATNYVLSGQMAWVFQNSRGAASSTGERGSASSTGDCSASACTGINSKAMAGDYGCIALAWWNKADKRAEMRCALTGKGGTLKAHVWYELDEKGNFKEVA